MPEWFVLQCCWAGALGEYLPVDPGIRNKQMANGFAVPEGDWDFVCLWTFLVSFMETCNMLNKWTNNRRRNYTNLTWSVAGLLASCLTPLHDSNPKFGSDKRLQVAWTGVWAQWSDRRSDPRCWLHLSLTKSLGLLIAGQSVLWAGAAATAAAKSLQSCLTLCDPVDGSPPGSPVPGILQARTLEWVAISFCNAWQWKVKVKLLSRARLLATPWTAAYQAPPSMGFSRQEYWSGVPLPSPMSCELWAATSSKDQVQLYCKENSEWLLFIRDTHPGNSPSFFC